MKHPARILILLATIWFAAGSLFAADPLPTRSPFGIQIVPAEGANGQKILRADFTVPAECVLYFDRLHFRTQSGDEVEPLKMPKPLVEMDKVTGKEKKVYEQNFSVELKPSDFPGKKVAVKFQGCTNAACFFPETRLFAPDAAGNYAEMDAVAIGSKPVLAVAGSVDWDKELKGFKVKGQQTGYLTPSEFTSFLGRSLSGQATSPLEMFANTDVLPMLLLIIFGGLLLNLTPCVLPMIPINLAIIGAGSVAQSRWEGFRNGLFYGAGMALAYGTLGLFVVLTGAKFGALNSSMWFNLSIAIVFIVMSLGMFDVIHIDFSRFGGSGTSTGRVSEKGLLVKHLLIMFMGVMSALLAGACVAPVVISVVLLATNFYAEGNHAGLLLPFLLGVGMALPWPFAGAGLSFLPKPGKWMVRVKHCFGVVILGFTVYYGHLAWKAHQTARNLALANTANPASATASPESDAELLVAIRQARDKNQPLFLDFHASWCKDCSAMDETVFNRDEVKQKLRDFVAVRYAAEKPDADPAKKLLDYFNIVGLPAYLVLAPK